MPFHAVFRSITLTSTSFIIIPSVPKYVYCLTYYFWQQLHVNRLNQTLFITVKTVVDFIRRLVVITYKHVSFCYAAANLATIAVFAQTYPTFKRIEFRSKQIATQFKGAKKTHLGLWTENLFNLLIHIKKIDIFPNDTVERI